MEKEKIMQLLKKHDAGVELYTHIGMKIELNYCQDSSIKLEMIDNPAEYDVESLKTFRAELDEIIKMAEIFCA